MKIHTMSIVCGTAACNARCPFCVSKITPESELPVNVSRHAWRNLGIACNLAEKAGATTCLITGKGEPTLYPMLVNKYIKTVNNSFPFIELQTNGMKIPQLAEEGHLKQWYKNGLTTVALSIVSLDQFYNEEIYGTAWGHCDHALEENIRTLHEHNLSVRLSVILLKGYGLDCSQGIDQLVSFCRMYDVEQLTVRPVTSCGGNSKESIWAKKNRPTDQELKKVYEYIGNRATPVLQLSHGATVYDFNGQNICITNCLTTNDTDDNIRQIIFFPDGTIGYDWKYKGARLL